jgi:hypothetical protein
MACGDRQRHTAGSQPGQIDLEELLAHRVIAIDAARIKREDAVDIGGRQQRRGDRDPHMFAGEIAVSHGHGIDERGRRIAPLQLLQVQDGTPRLPSRPTLVPQHGCLPSSAPAGQMDCRDGE